MPIRPLTYILQAKLLACVIRNNKNIIGFPRPSPNSDEIIETNLSTYVDDSQFKVLR